MAFDFTLMDQAVAGMRDMNPVTFTYKGVQYTGFRDILNSDAQMSLYGAHDAVQITVGILVSELKAAVKLGEKVVCFAPQFGRTGRELWILGMRNDAGGRSVRLDLEARYNDE